LSTAGQQKLQTFLEQGRTLLAFDFDGTLAPIVAHPRSARAPLAVVRALKSLLAMHEVAVLSGRSVDDLRARLGFAPHHLIGNHGAEDPGSELSRTQSATFRARLAPLREAAAGEWAEVLSTLGISMEDRGLSLSFHYRLSRDREAARVLIAEMLQAEGQGIRAFDGKLVIHVMAVEAPGKLEALRTLMARQGLERVLYAGDDPSDEAVFRQQGPGWFTLLVGGDARLSAAGFHLNATSDMPLFLAACRRCLRRSTG
jgi:trehalose 6-phosphate phosphatase